MDFNNIGFEPIFPVKSNPSRRADFCVRKNTASCVLSISKVFSDAEQLALAGGRKDLRSRLFVEIKNGFIMNENSKRKLKKTIGRPLKTDPAIIRYSVSLTEAENARFLALFDQSGMHVKAHFIKSCIFEKTVKTVQIDKGTVDFYMRLTSFHSQFRTVGVNYNQIIKLLYKNFSEKKASAYLFKLEKQTAEMAMLCRKIIELSEEFEEKYLKKTAKK